MVPPEAARALGEGAAGRTSQWRGCRWRSHEPVARLPPVAARALGDGAAGGRTSRWRGCRVPPEAARALGVGAAGGRASPWRGSCWLHEPVARVPVAARARREGDGNRRGRRWPHDTRVAQHCTGLRISVTSVLRSSNDKEFWRSRSGCVRREHTARAHDGHIGR